MIHNLFFNNVIGITPKHWKLFEEKKIFINFSSKKFQNFDMWVGLIWGCARGIYGAHANARARPIHEKISFCNQEIFAIIKDTKKYHQKSVEDKFFEKKFRFSFWVKIWWKKRNFQLFFQIGQKCSKVLYVLWDGSQCVQGVRNTLGTYYGHVKRSWDFSVIYPRAYVQISLISGGVLPIYLNRRGSAPFCVTLEPPRNM